MADNINISIDGVVNVAVGITDLPTQIGVSASSLNQTISIEALPGEALVDITAVSPITEVLVQIGSGTSGPSNSYFPSGW